MSKEDFVEKMLKNEYGKKQARKNKALRDGRNKDCNGDAYIIRKEGRIKATKQMPKAKRY